VREVRQRYAKLARQWHPDHHSTSPELLREATERMAEINAAYRIARQYLRRPATRRSTARSTEPGNTSSVQSSRRWSRVPWGNQSLAFEREARIVCRLLVVVLLVWPGGELVRRIVPVNWQVWVSIAMAAGVVVGSIVVWQRDAD
jgi:hypothetical protein